MYSEVITIQELSFTAVFEPADNGGYTVTCPTLPGVVTEGNTLNEARELVKDAIAGYLDILREDGESIPIEENFGNPISANVTVELKGA